MQTGKSLATDYMFRAFFYAWVILGVLWAPFHFTKHYSLRVWVPTVGSVGLLIFAIVKLKKEKEHNQKQVWKATLRAYISNVAALVAYIVLKPHLGHELTLQIVGGVWLLLHSMNSILTIMAFVSGHDPEPG